MFCNFSQEKLEAYALGLLDEVETAHVREHLRGCQECQHITAKHEQATRLLGKAFDEAPAEWMVGKTMANLKDRPAGKKSWLVWGVPGLAGAAALLLMFSIHPGRIAKQAMHPAAKRSMAPVAVMAQEKERREARPELAALADTGSEPAALAGRTSTAAAPKAKAEAAAVARAADVLTIQLKNPIDDRSIYEDLGVATEVAKLLL